MRMTVSWLTASSVDLNHRIRQNREYLKRHQLIAYFTLTYVFSWALWIPLQQLVLDGKSYLMPLISLGVFAPALVGIGLSAILKSRPREGRRQPAVIAFIVAWILASGIIIMDLITNGQRDLSITLAVCRRSHTDND